MVQTTRRRMLEITTDYLDAMVRHSPQGLPLSEDVRCTYNSEVSAPGDNELWRRVRRIPQRQSFVDEQTGNVVFFGIVTNEVLSMPGVSADAVMAWWFYILRLKIEDGRITEIEEIAAPSRQRGFLVDIQEVPLPEMLFEVPIDPEDRMTREELVDVANCYWDGIENKIPYERLPVHPDARRCELGLFTTDNPQTPDSLKTNIALPGFTWDIRQRRFPVVDPKRGLVISAVSFRQKSPQLPTGMGSAVMEIFRIEDGLMKFLYAFFLRGAPEKSPWVEE